MLPSPYSPNRELTIGIIGGGQLAKMLAQAAYRLGLRVAIIEHGADSPAGRMTQLEFPEGWNSREALEAFLRVSDIITLENEFVAPELLEGLAQHRPVYPTPETIRRVRDKLTQKQTMVAAGIPVPSFAGASSSDDVLQFAEDYGFPVVLKTRTFGYDGYGNRTVYDRQALPEAWTALKQRTTDSSLLVEQFVQLQKELAVIVARNRRGDIAVYPCVETVQQDHVCRVVYAPAPIPEPLRRRAQEIAVACVEAVDGVGVFGVELFLTTDGDILFNELAPRPHNSGHYTIEACYTSQFENGIRAICNLPLGSPEMIVPAAVMINLLGVRSGSGIPDSVLPALRVGKAWLHLYGKRESRVRRKMGHVTAVGQTLEEAYAHAQQAAEGVVW
ncbi:MAG: 5-(carboxyamino)imidazole ribonucleotide synthase [Candidatus Kapabacteria bacterium]|nr:5-(carboxyamino)imidazole ribonucleotide synthase [Candidatus Kapabacteria bacterium]MDW8012053.1 5-(carboxyamino)imidazole ribonucleotide synthase [Bacteroidota bacterium]